MMVGLFPVSEVYAGSLLYPAEAATEVFERFREMDAGGDFTGAFNVTAFPPLEIVPEPIRGKAFAILRGCHVDAAAGQRLVDEWRAWRAPALDMFGFLPFARAEGQDGVARAALAFTPATRERLATLKRSVDPGGVFRHGI
jgi:hypothetical protein